MAKKSGYILGNVIARGGMAEIFLGKAVGEGAFHRLCAIKRILPHYSSDKEFIKMFKDEASICQGLHHANIVQVYDFKKIENSYALVMEFVEGADLRTTLSTCEKYKTRLTIPMIVYIVAEAARGLHYAHTKLDEETHKPLGIIHRDISPQNVLVSYEGEVKITDFGIADSDHRETETKPGVVKGKYSYMSPEQVNAKKLDARTDIFSLAIILWEALAMRRLFAGQNEVETIKRVQTAEVRYNLQEINPKVDDKLMRIIMKGLQPDRKKRFQTAKEFEKELLKYLHSYFPDYNSGELSSFMNALFKEKRQKVKKDIKDLLSKTIELDEASIAVTGTQEQKSITGLKKNSSEGGMDAFEIEMDGPNDMNIGVNSVPPASSITKIPQFTKVPGGTRTNMKGNAYDSQLRYTIDAQKGRSQSSSPSRSNLILSILAVLLIAGGFFAFKDFQMQGAAKTPTYVELDGPQHVLIELNGKLLNDGKYIKLPYRVKVPVGEHRLKVMRQGFLSKLFRLRIKNAGDIIKRNILLTPDQRIQMAPVKISLQGVDRVFIDIDQGFFTTELNSVSPIYLKNDLKFGVEHQLMIRQANSQKAYLCRFTPKSYTMANPYHIMVYPRNGVFACKAFSN